MGPSNAYDVRPLGRADTADALALYTELTFGPATQEAGPFHAVLDHPGTTVFGAIDTGRVVAMTTLHLLPNVTWNARPYGLVENVVTAQSHQRRGIGRLVMAHVIAAAWAKDAYKIMLLTGQKRGAKGFYEAVGFSSEDKHAMVIRRP